MTVTFSNGGVQLEARHTYDRSRAVGVREPPRDLEANVTGQSASACVYRVGAKPLIRSNFRNASSSVDNNDMSRSQDDHFMVTILLATISGKNKKYLPISNFSAGPLTLFPTEIGMPAEPSFCS